MTNSNEDSVEHNSAKQAPVSRFQLKGSHSRSWVTFSILTLILTAGFIWISRDTSQNSSLMGMQSPAKGFIAPDFSLQTPDGTVYNLSNARGNPVIVNIWASWCPPCRAEMPALERVYQDYRNSGLVVLGVNATHLDNPTTALDFVKQLDLSFPILMDIDGRVTKSYRVSSLPTTFFVDDKGEIREVVVGGPMAEALLRIRIEQMLSDISE